MNPPACAPSRRPHDRRSRSRTVAFVASVLAALAPAAHSTPFVPEAVTSGGSAAEYTSLALDPLGRPHIAYYASSTLSVSYATKDALGWMTEPVEALVFGFLETTPSIAVDALGDPHVAYVVDVAGPSAEIHYATKSGGVWTIEPVVVGLGVGLTRWTSIALTSMGSPCIAFAGPGGLTYATKSPGWVTEVADPAGASLVSLALDALDRPHIGWFDGGGLAYTAKSGVWTTEAVDPAGALPNVSIALDVQGRPHIAYTIGFPGPFDLMYAYRTGPTWVLETVDGTAGCFYGTLALDDVGNARVGYMGGTDLNFAARDGVWAIETVDALGATGEHVSLKLDVQGNARMSYIHMGEVYYTDSAVHVISPAGGETWPVGALRDVEWSGGGPVDISVSADGGATEELLLADVQSSPVTIRVPHVPSRFARVKIERADPRSTARSDSLFTIETSIALLSFQVAARGGGAEGAVLLWSTQPGPEDLAGYRVERVTSAGAWEPVASTSQTSLLDPGGRPGTEYRLIAVNGLGMEFVLGQARLGVQPALAAGPLPYRSGDLTIRFATTGGLGGGTGSAEVALYDVAGRLVRSVTRGEYPAGFHSTVWDGRDADGRTVPAGAYLLRAVSGGRSQTMKVTVLR